MDKDDDSCLESEIFSLNFKFRSKSLNPYVLESRSNFKRLYYYLWIKMMIPAWKAKSFHLILNLGPDH